MLGAVRIGGLAFENCVSMAVVRAENLKQCAVDAFLNTNTQLQTGFKGKLVDVCRVGDVDEKKFQYLKKFEYCAKQPENWLVWEIRRKANKSLIKRLRSAMFVVSGKRILEFKE